MIRIGAGEPQKIYLGEAEVAKIYLGGALVYEAGSQPEPPGPEPPEPPGPEPPEPPGPEPPEPPEPEPTEEGTGRIVIGWTTIGRQLEVELADAYGQHEWEYAPETETLTVTMPEG